MDIEQYDHWYYTPRGQWIGHCELELLFNALKPRPGESLLYIGCGTGFFTRQMGSRIRGEVIGVDIIFLPPFPQVRLSLLKKM